MTCIAVKIEGKKIHIAGDSQATWGKNKIPVPDLSDKQIKASGKIFQVNGMTIGCAGSLNHIGFLQMFSKTHKPKEMTKDDIMEWFIEFREWVADKAKINIQDISIHGIIVSNNLVFTFYDFMEVQQVKTFDSVGSGMWLALGALELNASAKEAVKVAIK